MKRYAFLMAAALLATTTACGGDDCAEGTEKVSGQSVCVSAPFAAGQPLSIDVETDPITGCAKPTCTAERQAGEVFLFVTRDACGAETGEGCPEKATSAVVTCEVPALDEGGYTVRVNGEARFGMLSVAAGGTATECSFR